jgi:hypothetical protein
MYFPAAGALFAGTLLAGTLPESTPAFAVSRHAAASGAVVRLSTVTTYQGGTFRIQTMCPEPSRSTRLESDLFASPALLPARMSRQVWWTVDVSPKQAPGEYWISLSCFQLLTGRVTAAAQMRVHVLGPLLRAVSRQHARPAGHDARRAGPTEREVQRGTRSAELRPKLAVRASSLRPGREGSDGRALYRHPLDEGKGGYDRGRHHRLF